VPYCPDIEFDSSGKVTWYVEVESLQLPLNLRWAGVKGDGSKEPLKSLIQIQDSRFVYEDANRRLLVVVEETQSFDKVVWSKF